MRYRADISGEEYAAMEEGYEQGLARQPRVIPDREHVVQLSREERMALLKFIESPNGSHSTGRDNRVCVEAVEGGGLLIRTQPFRSRR